MHEPLSKRPPLPGPETPLTQMRRAALFKRCRDSESRIAASGGWEREERGSEEMGWDGMERGLGRLVGLRRRRPTDATSTSLSPIGSTHCSCPIFDSPNCRGGGALGRIRVFEIRRCCTRGGHGMAWRGRCSYLRPVRRTQLDKPPD